MICLSPHHLQGGALQVTPHRRTFLRMVIFLILCSFIHAPARAATGEIQGFRLSVCSDDHTKCYVVTSPRVEHSWNSYQYVFRTATLTVFDRHPDGRLTEIQTIVSDDGYVHAPSGTLVIRRPGHETVYDFRTNKILSF